MSDTLFWLVLFAWFWYWTWWIWSSMSRIAELNLEIHEADKRLSEIRRSRP